MIEFTVANGEICVKSVAVTTLGTASNFTVGDIKEIHLVDAFESPPENLIVGVTIPTVPAVSPQEDTAR